VIKSLLVGLDGSPLAEVVLPYVETIARATGAIVTLVRAVPSRPQTEPLQDVNVHLIPFTFIMPTERPHRLDESARNEYYEAEHYLDWLVECLGDQGIKANAVVARGCPAMVILDEAEARHADLILLTRKGRSGLGRLVHGSVTEAVLAKSPVPVFLARAGSTGRRPWFGGKDAPILVALDGSAEAERVLPLAMELARATSTGFSLVEVVSAVPRMTFAESSWVGETPPDDRIRDVEITHSYLAAVRERVRESGIPVTASVRTDAIGSGITAAANECGASLIAMATHARTGIDRALPGHGALDVLQRAGLPMLLIGPHIRSSAS